MFEHFEDVKADWLKVGTMLIASHLIAGGDVMDQGWQMSSLYTLLGFTAYHLVVKNMFDVSAVDFNPIANDWLKVGTMLTVSRLLSGQPLDQGWAVSSLMTLLGFTLYHLITKNFVQGSSFTDNPGMAEAIDDAAKFGTMFIFTHLMSGGDLGDETWHRSSAGILAGFALYDLVVKNLLAGL